SVIYGVIVQLSAPEDVHRVPSASRLGEREFAYVVARLYDQVLTAGYGLTEYDIALPGAEMETDARGMAAKIAIEITDDRAALPRDERECLLGYEQLVRQDLPHGGAAALVAREMTLRTLGAYGISPKQWSGADVVATVARARARLAGELPTVPDELATAA